MSRRERIAAAVRGPGARGAALGALSGAVAGMVMVLGTLMLRLLAGVPLPTELVTDRLLTSPIGRVPIVPAAFLTYADYPIYALYELAPRVNGIAAITDQQAAGLIMKAVADPIIWLAMAIVFFRWQRVEEAADRAERARRGRGTSA